MKKIILLFILVFMISSISALEASIECPNEVFQGEEFTCKINIAELEQALDVKLDILGNGNRISQLWNETVWRSGYYYYISAITENGEKSIKARIWDTQDNYKNFVGPANASFILRLTGKSTQVFTDNFNIIIKENQTEIPEEPEEPINNTPTETIQNTTNQDQTTTETQEEPVILTPVKIDINTAPAEELDKLDGVGPTYAQRIVEYRQTTKFCSIEELTNIKGIGPATLEKIKQQNLAYVDPCEQEPEVQQTASTSENQQEQSTENIINLAKQEKMEQQITGNVVYESKTEVIRKYAIYAFSILLIGIIFLILKK